MSDIWYAPYQLHSVATLNARSQRRSFSGALIRQGSGFGCVHPWPELGDPPLQDCLVDPESVLMKRALLCATADGLAREKGVSLFQNQCVPESHATLPAASHDSVERALHAGFKVVKVKAKQSLGELKSLIRDFPQLRWRVDFNCSADGGSLQEDLRGLETFVDFIEDPFPFDSLRWAAFEKVTGVSLANDWSVEKGMSCGVHIIKPAVNDPKPIMRRSGRKIFTSYMDHPLGQTFAAWQAASFEEANGTHGLQTHHLFEPNPFTEILGPHRPGFQNPPGTGLGFDSLLESLDWIRLDV